MTFHEFRHVADLVVDLMTIAAFVYVKRSEPAFRAWSWFWLLWAEVPVAVYVLREIGWIAIRERES